MSLFITFEGGEGSGKSTQARALYRRLSKQGLPAVLTHEPGGTPLGNNMRRWLKWAKEIHSLTEFLLSASSRAQLVAEVIGPALEKGAIVICDRYADSTTAYQGYGRGLDLGLIEAINNAATGGLCPNLVVLLDTEAEKGLQRKRSKKDRFEREEHSFHQRVREGYLKMARDDPQRWLVVDATLPRAKVERIIWEMVSQLLSR